MTMPATLLFCLASSFAAPPVAPADPAPYVRRFAPERRTLEVGGSIGAVFPARAMELFAPRGDRSNDGFRPLSRWAPAATARVGYYPWRIFGVEAEGLVGGLRVDRAGFAALWGARAQAVGQIGLWSVVPFVVAGGGVIAIASRPGTVGNDIDPSAHFGAGVKANLTRRLGVRLDVRDMLTSRRGIGGGVSHNPEVWLGVTLRFGPRATPPAPRDTDADGRLDRVDRCPLVPARTDDGCPPADTDGDLVIDTADACPSVAESIDGVDDDDGCPEMPPLEVRLDGVLEGVEFATDSAAIDPASFAVLDAAVEALIDRPEHRVRIVGHTDDVGDREHNMDLSRRRAESVAEYLVGHGVDPDRIETRGAGPHFARDTNATAQGRARNRRIEFQLLTDDEDP